MSQKVVGLCVSLPWVVVPHVVVLEVTCPRVFQVGNYPNVYKSHQGSFPWGSCPVCVSYYRMTELPRVNFPRGLVV